jgi:hypothetical protein
VHEVAADVVARVERAMPTLPSAVDLEVERLWQAARQRVAAGGAGRLFNGRVFSADAITPDLITGHLTEFRRIVAQMERPELFAELGLRPLAVCGVLRCANGVGGGIPRRSIRRGCGNCHRLAAWTPARWGQMAWSICAASC